LLRFVITFTLSWKIWNDMAMIIAWFETDDIFQRFSVLFLLACLFGYTTNIVQAFETTYASLIGFYLTARLYMVIYLVIVAWLVPTVRGVMLYTVFTALLSAALWIGSIHTTWPRSLALIWVALFMDILGQNMHFGLLFAAEKYGGRTQAFSDKWFQFWPGAQHPSPSNIIAKADTTAAQP
jgi:low temperature requirement protein LtrA